MPVWGKQKGTGNYQEYNFLTQYTFAETTHLFVSWLWGQVLVMGQLLHLLIYQESTSCSAGACRSAALGHVLKVSHMLGRPHGAIHTEQK